MIKLAIVIPAYKNNFFEQTLLSIANQINKNFRLYIGDDDSPSNLDSIVSKFENIIPIYYKKFDENIGINDLVSQWERCIDLIGNEEWIWLFSDDDLMDPMCVENFYSTLNQFPEFDIFHFNLSKIDERNNIIGNFYDFPSILTCEEFLIGKLNVGYFSTVVEYVFRKSNFVANGRFQNFDLGWGSDDATWIKLSKYKGIKNIENAKVYWRKSLFNISPNNCDIQILKRKYNSQIQFSKWICDQANHNNLNIEIHQLEKLLFIWFYKTIKARIDILPFSCIEEITYRFCCSLKLEKKIENTITRLYLIKMFRSIVKLFKCYF